MDPSKEIRGGKFAHYCRRLFHLSLLLAPPIYFIWLPKLFSQHTLKITIFVVIVLIMILEVVRYHRHFLFFGQRQYESTHISTFVWTIVPLLIVLRFAPMGYATAIIWTCALVDPLMGELRINRVPAFILIPLGILVAGITWFFVARCFGFSPALALLMAPLTVLLEWPSFAWIDDNALMLLVPLIVVYL